MAKPKITRNNQADSESSDLVVWTNVSKNPVILGDGSTVGAGEQTTPEQAEFAEGSLWEEHGVLVSGAPVITDDGAGQIEELVAEIEALRYVVSRLKDDLDGEVTAARGFNVEHEELKSELEGLKAENDQLKADGESATAQLGESEAKVKTLQAEVESLKKPTK